MISAVVLVISLTSFTITLANMPFQIRTHSLSNMATQGLNFPQKQVLDHDKNNHASVGEETNFYLEGLKRGYLKKLSGEDVMPYAADIDVFQRNRKSHTKECSILVQKTEMQVGKCTRLADNTPACHNDQYLAINPNEC